MVRLAIRDDDCNYFTKVEDLQNLYKGFDNCIVSYAVIPAVTDVSTIGRCPDTKGNKNPMYVGDNYSLVQYLKDEYKSGKCDILMHGINHSYLLMGGGKVLTEMQLQDNNNDLTKQIEYWRNKLQLLFQAEISCFVAPSNVIKSKGLRAVIANGMNFSGIIMLKMDRKMSINNLCSWLKRWRVRFHYGIPYPGVIDYGDHKEINACSIRSYEFLVKVFDYCSKRNLPMAINVHYWHLRDNPDKLALLHDFYEYAIRNGAVPTKLSDLLK